MNFWESLLEAFSGSSRNTNSIEQTRMLNIIKQIALETGSTDKKTDTNGKQDINEEEEEPTGFISDAADKVGSVFSRCKSPYFTTNKKLRGGPKKYDRSIEGDYDPFYDYLNELYPGKGLQGFREENLDKFKKISKGTVSLASQRYVKVEKVLKKVKSIAAIPIAIGSFIFFPKLASYINPIVYGIGMYAFADCLLHLPETLRDIHNRRIFAARYRIGKDIGAIGDSGKVNDWFEYYKHDYGKELTEEEFNEE